MDIDNLITKVTKKMKMQDFSREEIYKKHSNKRRCPKCNYPLTLIAREVFCQKCGYMGDF